MQGALSHVEVSSFLCPAVCWGTCTELSSVPSKVHLLPGATLGSLSQDTCSSHLGCGKFALCNHFSTEKYASHIVLLLFLGFGPYFTPVTTLLFLTPFSPPLSFCFLFFFSSPSSISTFFPPTGHPAKGPCALRELCWELGWMASVQTKVLCWLLLSPDPHILI